MINRQLYLPYFLGAAFAIQLLLLWYFSFLAIENKVLPTNFDYFIRFFIIITGGFLGVWSAYEFRKSESKNEEVKLRFASLNQAMIAVARQRSIKEGLDARIETHLIFTDELVRLKPVRLPLASKLNIDINSVSFAIELGYPNLVNALIDQEHYYHGIIESVSIWNDLYHQVDTTNSGTTDKSRLRELEDAIAALQRSMDRFTKCSDTVVNDLNLLASNKFPNRAFMECKIA
jgi:hypothetical protein